MGHPDLGSSFDRVLGPGRGSGGRAQYLVQARHPSENLVTRKFHLAGTRLGAALCGHRPEFPFNVSAQRDEFERACPQLICKRCRRAAR